MEENIELFIDRFDSAKHDRQIAKILCKSIEASHFDAIVGLDKEKT
jgi:hypothetical protein